MNNFFKTAFKRIFGSETQEQRQTLSADSAAQENAEVVEVETALNLTIWIIERTRYSAARALCTDVSVYPSVAVSLCEEIKGYVLDTPNGECVVVEARTGSLVGHTLEVVRDGVREMTMLQLNNQLDTARKEFNRMSKHELSNDEFWKAIKMGGDEIEVVQDYQE